LADEKLAGAYYGGATLLFVILIKNPADGGTSGENNLIHDELRFLRHSFLSFYGFGSVLDL